ncbi:MAG: FtsX-like permease family protein [Opitutaceae bacterium]|jgi:putative ABC transport system permease protein
MNFILKMAWRDSRTARRRLGLFSLSIVFGVAALVAVGSFSANLRRGIDDQAKGLLGADLVVSSRAPLAPGPERFIAGLGGEQAREITFSSMIAFPASGGQTRLVTVRALDGGYPFYGTYRTAPADAAGRVAAGGAVVVDETLMRQFGVKEGDPLRLGTKTLTVVGTIQQLPGEASAAATLSPRVIVALSVLPETGLVGRGSLVRYRTYLKLPATSDADKIAAEMKRLFRDEHLHFDTVAGRKRELGKALENVYAFLSLTGFVSLLLGAIGVASAIHVHIGQKLATVAVLRCLGASARQGFAIYLVQGLALGGLGAVMGALLGVAVQLVLPPLVRDLLPFEVHFFVSWAAVARGLAAGLAVSGLFTLLPLLAVRRVSPLAAIRAAFAVETGGRDVLRWVVGGVIVVAVAGFAVWQTGRWSWGLGFTGGLALVLGALAGLARVVAWMARRFMPRRLPYVWRQGVANLHRPNNRTTLLLLSLGLGTFLLLTLALSRETLVRQIRGADGGGRPNLLFFDIQDDQIGPLTALLSAQGVPALATAPVVTMRLAGINGRTVDELLKDKAAGIPAWTLRREYRSTYRAALSDTEKLTAGKLYGRVEPTQEPAPVSIEEGLAKDMRLKLGDELEFDVQGVPVKTRVASLRSVEWRRMAPNFFIVFPEGVLESAPKFFVVAGRAAGSEESARVQQAVVREFSNVSVLDLALVLKTLDTIFSKAELVIRFMAWFTVATGVVVLVGAVTTGRFQRIRETVLLRTLGASRRQLMQIQFVEHAVLGMLAALVGGLLAWAAGTALAVFVFDAPVVAPVGLFAGAVVAVTALTVLTGWMSGRGIANHPPLEVLREES